jgi:PTS system glucose-specific IIA component
MFNFLKNSKVIDLYAPIEGTIKLIEGVPDAIFAEKMVGDGIAIEPTAGIVVAPCDGKIVQISSTNHAVGIETESGLEILIHVGMDTVELKGDGFKRIAEVDTKVKKGDVLLEVDLERIKVLGKPTITPFIITNMEEADITYMAEGKAAAGETVVMKVKVKKEKK